MNEKIFFAQIDIIDDTNHINDIDDENNETFLTNENEPANNKPDATNGNKNNSDDDDDEDITTMTINNGRRSASMNHHHHHHPHIIINNGGLMLPNDYIACADEFEADDDITDEYKDSSVANTTTLPSRLSSTDSFVNYSLRKYAVRRHHSAPQSDLKYSQVSNSPPFFNLDF